MFFDALFEAEPRSEEFASISKPPFHSAADDLLGVGDTWVREPLLKLFCAADGRTAINNVAAPADASPLWTPRICKILRLKTCREPPFSNCWSPCNIQLVCTASVGVFACFRLIGLLCKTCAKGSGNNELELEGSDFRTARFFTPV